MHQAALYVRVSTDGQTVENQVSELRALAVARGFAAETLRIHADEAISGASDRRPGLDALMEDVHRGRVKAVFVWALDRLSRRGVYHLHGLLERFRKSGVALVSAREPWLNTDGPIAELLLSIFAWVAQQERLRTVERTKAGLARARRQGIRLGRPSLPAHLLDRGLALVAQGLSVRQAAKDAGKGRCGRSDCAACRTKDGHTLSPRSLSRALKRAKN